MNPYNMPYREAATEQKEEKTEVNYQRRIRALLKLPFTCPLLLKTVVVIQIVLCMNYSPFVLKNAFGSSPFCGFDRESIKMLFTETFSYEFKWNIVLAFIVWLPQAYKFEKSIGTIRYAFLVLVNATLIQIFFAAFARSYFYCYGTGNIIGQSAKYALGLFPYAIMEMTMNVLANRGQPARCFIHSRWYYAVIVICFTAINGVCLLPVIGIGYGVVYYYHLRAKMYPSDEVIAKVEQCIPFCWMTNKIGFISLKDADEYNLVQIDLNATDSLKA